MGEAWQVFGRSTRWFGRHYPVVAAFGLVASAQRFISVRGDTGSSWAGGARGELFTAASRIGFLAWCVRKVFTGSTTPAREFPRRLTNYGRNHAGAVVAGGALLGVLTVVAKVIPDAAISPLGGDSRRRASAWELAIKNMTIIPFTIVWMVIGVRHASEVGGSVRPR